MHVRTSAPRALATPGTRSGATETCPTYTRNKGNKATAHTRAHTVENGVCASPLRRRQDRLDRIILSPLLLRPSAICGLHEQALGAKLPCELYPLRNAVNGIHSLNAQFASTGNRREADRAATQHHVDACMRDTNESLSVLLCLVVQRWSCVSQPCNRANDHISAILGVLLRQGETAAPGAHCPLSRYRRITSTVKRMFSLALALRRDPVACKARKARSICKPHTHHRSRQCREPAVRKSTPWAAHRPEAAPLRGARLQATRKACRPRTGFARTRPAVWFAWHQHSGS